MKKETKSQAINEAIQIAIAHGNELLEINDGFSNNEDMSVMKYRLSTAVVAILSQDTRLTRMVIPGDTHYPPFDGFEDENARCIITCYAEASRGEWITPEYGQPWDGYILSDGSKVF